LEATLNLCSGFGANNGQFGFDVPGAAVAADSVTFTLPNSMETHLEILTR
jgi:hypothetical protein